MGESIASICGDISTPKTTDTSIHIESPNQLDRLVANSVIVLVDYHVGWCGPCKVLEPTVKEIAEETDAVVAEVDIDELQELAREQGIRNVPTLQFYAGGEQVKEATGVQNRGDLIDIIETAM